MRFGAPNSIILNGLMLHVDAAEKACYASGGTTTKDLKNNLPGLFVNSPTWTSEGGGAFVFNGASSQYIWATTSSLNPYVSGNPVSLFVWVYSTAAGGVVVETGQQDFTGWYDNQIEIASDGKVSFAVWSGSLTPVIRSTFSIMNTWTHVGFCYNGSTMTGYVNGSAIATTSSFTRQTPYPSRTLLYALGAATSTNMGVSSYLTGKISTFMAYNRALSTAEVNRNFNATRGRFKV